MLKRVTLLTLASCLAAWGALAKLTVIPSPDICLHQGELYAGPYLRRIDPDTGMAQILWDKAFITCMTSDGPDLWLGTRLETVVRLRFADDGSIAQEQEWSLVPILHDGRFPHPCGMGENYGVYDVRPFRSVVYALTECGYAEMDRTTGVWQRREAFVGPDREPVGLIGGERPLAFLSLQRARVYEVTDADFVVQSIDTHQDLLTIPVHASLQPGPITFGDGTKTNCAHVEYRGLSAVLPGEDGVWIAGGGVFGFNPTLLLRYGPAPGVVERFDLGVKHGHLSDACRHGDVIWLSVWQHEGGSLIRFDCNTHESEVFHHEGPVWFQRFTADSRHVYILGQVLERGWFTRDTSRLLRFDIAAREFVLLPTRPMDVRTEHMWGPES